MVMMVIVNTIDDSDSDDDDSDNDDTWQGSL